MQLDRQDGWRELVQPEEGALAEVSDPWNSLHMAQQSVELSSNVLIASKRLRAGSKTEADGRVFEGIYNSTTQRMRYSKKAANWRRA